MIKAIAIVAILIAIAFAIFFHAQYGERKIQILQKGVPVAGADVSILDREWRQIHLTTTNDGSFCLPAACRAPWVHLRITKEKDVIMDEFIGEPPAGVTIIDFVASNRMRITRKWVLLGVITIKKTSELFGSPAASKSGGTADAGQTLGSEKEPASPEAGANR